VPFYPSALPTFALLIASLPLCAEDRPTPAPAAIATSPGDWAWWRGPTRDGIATGRPPLVWSATENVLWKSPVSGRGHGSPIVVGDRIFLATADHEKEIQSVLCFDRETGNERWATEVHKGGFEKKGNVKASLASSTLACDGSRVFITFLHSAAIYVTALDLDGKQLWQKKVTDYTLHQGFGSSPTVYRDLVIVSADNKGKGVIAAFDRITGNEVWKIERPKQPNYTSPIVYKLDGRDQLLFTGCDLVTSLDPTTGKKLWEIPGSTTECVTSVVTDGKHIFTSGGYPRNHISAVLADGSGKVVWENNTRVYVPSMLVKDGYLYAVLDAGIAMCFDCATGKELWKGRLGGTFTASPILVGDTIFATNEAGRTYVFKAKPDKFVSLGEKNLGDEAFATPTTCGDRIYMRVAKMDKGKRQEMLYCIGSAAKK